jgi:hypothetical protein
MLLLLLLLLLQCPESQLTAPGTELFAPSHAECQQRCCCCCCCTALTTVTHPHLGKHFSAASHAESQQESVLVAMHVLVHPVVVGVQQP